MPTSAVSAWFVGGGGGLPALTSLVRHSGAYSFLVQILGGGCIKICCFLQFFAVFCSFFVNLVSLYTYSLLAISIFYISLSPPPRRWPGVLIWNFRGGLEGLLKDSDKKNDKYTQVHCTGYLLLLPLSHWPTPHILYAHLSPLILWDHP